MKNTLRRLSALLAFAMVLGLFSAFPAAVGAADVWSATYPTDIGNINVSGPTSVNEGETFDVTFTVDNVSGMVQGLEMDFYIDNRYVVYDTEYTASKDEITPPLTVVHSPYDSWELLCNGLSSGAYIEATDKSAPSMSLVYFGIGTPDIDTDYMRAGDTLVITLRLRAVATGTANFSLGMVYLGDVDWEPHYYSEESAPCSYTVKVIGEGVDDSSVVDDSSDVAVDEPSDDLVSKDVSDDVVSEDVSADVSEDVSVDISTDVSADVSEDISEDIPSDDVSDDVSEDVSEDVSGDDEELIIKNLAPNATYRGTDSANGTTNYGEANWNTYHAGKLNDGVIPNGDSESTKGQNVEIYISGFVAGTVYVYFDLGVEKTVTELITYTNDRLSSTNRGYPSKFNVYVGNSESLSEATLFGAAVTTDTGAVRKYTATGEATGRFVILELGISTPDIVIALSEVEIMGYGDASVEPELPKLTAPTLSSSTGRFTYTVPTITWEAVEGAAGYDVYLDGVLAIENTPELSYTPSVSTRANYNASNAYKVSVVANSDNAAFESSVPSQAVEFIYVDRPTDINGNPRSTADFIIDAGHGGTDPGALGNGGAREEADDNLAMAKAVGERLAALGFTVVYTRTTDVYETVLTKAAKGEAGSFGYYLCFHRNSFSDERAAGVETLYRPNASGSNKALARLVQDEIMALGVFTNRNIKERTDLTVLNNVTSMPAILMELSFISNSSDNEKFDTYFNDIAAAVVKGAVVNAGYKLGFEGAVVVNDYDYTILDEELVVHVTVPNYDAAKSVLDVEFVVANGLGVSGVSANLNGGNWVELEPDNSFVYFGLEQFKTPAVHYTYQKDFFGVAAGLYTLRYKLFHSLAAGEIYTAENQFLTINITVEGKAELGDANGDGAVDNLDALLILKYDAGLSDESTLNLSVSDINDDGAVDNLDALLVLKYDAGIIEGFDSNEVDYTAKRVRTAAVTIDGEEFPLYQLISTKSELDRYIEIYTELYGLDYAGYNSPSFIDLAAEYDESFFESRGLVLVMEAFGSGSITQEVTGVSFKDGVLTVDDTVNIPFLMTTDIAYWHVILELDEDIVAGIEDIDFNTTTVYEAESDIDA